MAEATAELSLEIELVSSFNKQIDVANKVLEKQNGMNEIKNERKSLNLIINEALEAISKTDKLVDATDPVKKITDLFAIKAEEQKLFFLFIDDKLKKRTGIDLLNNDFKMINNDIKNANKIFEKPAFDPETDQKPLDDLKKSLVNFQKKFDDILVNVNEDLYEDDEKDVDHLLKQLSAIVFNDVLPVAGTDDQNLYTLKYKIQECIKQIDEDIQVSLDSVLHEDGFKELESNWRALDDLIMHTDFSKNIKIDILDVTEDELREDFENNRVDVSSSSFFKKVYFAEYDQYGGQPYGTIIGLYEFKSTARDINWLRTMGKIASASHAPFISSVGPDFFGCKDIQELSEMKDMRGHLSQPGFDKWNDFRDSEEAAYLGFTLPRFMARQPFDNITNPADELNYNEKIEGHDDYLWANAAMLFARNILNSFAHTSWCQTIRGPKNGGKIENLPRHQFRHNGLDLIKIPVEMIIPDYRELDLADSGFIPLIFEKGTANACYFSSQSIKKSKHFKDPQDTENSQLVTNLSYTLSITRIAHYIKCIMRDNIGGPADAAYINQVIQSWLSNYVTTVVNPDDLTLRHYPFKAITVETTEREGMVGWYDCIVNVLPHLQFEGLDVELRLEVRL